MNQLIYLFQVRLKNSSMLKYSIVYIDFLEPTPLPKPISNGKSKAFSNKVDDTSSEEDENDEPSAMAIEE